MNNFNFYSPTYFAFGKDGENQAGSLVKRFGGTKVLIHYGGGSVVRSGLLDRVKASLNAEGINAFAAFLKSIGMPANFAELGAKEEDIPQLVETLCCGDGRNGSISGFVTLDKEDCTKIYKMMV